MKFATLDELLVLAHRLTEGWGPDTYPYQLAQGLIDMLGEGSRCGIEPFDVLDGELVIGDTNCLEAGDRLSPDDARARARLLLSGADQAESEVR